MIMSEPDLEEVLGDPIVHLLMASDRVDVDELRCIIGRVRTSLVDRTGIVDRGGSQPVNGVGTYRPSWRTKELRVTSLDVNCAKVLDMKCRGHDLRAS